MAEEGKDWTTDLLDRLDHYIGLVRSNTTDRLVRIARLLVFGLIAVIVGSMAAILALIALIRILDVILPREVWLPYVALGAIFLAAGMFLWSKKTVPPRPRHPGGRDRRRVTQPSMNGTRDVIIVGSGPAGLTAAIYTARANLRPLVFEGVPSSTGDQPGGQLMLTTEVENYPGFVDGIQGPELMAAMRAQAARFGAEFVTEKIDRVDFTSSPAQVWVGDAEYRGRAVIVATGARAKMLGLDNERRLLGHGVSTCATCDGFFFKGQQIAVVGGGDSALEEATFLTKFAEKVTVIHRRDKLRASKIMQERAFKNDKIEFLWDSVPVDLEGEERLTGATIKNVKTGELSHLDVTGMFVAIGHHPNTNLFVGQLAMDDASYLLTHRGTHLNVDGVFAAGDVQDRTYRQAVTAAGSGCMAAIDAERWLESQPHASDIKQTPTEW